VAVVAPNQYQGCKLWKGVGHVLTVMAIALVGVLVVLYFGIVPLRPVVFGLVHEVRAQRQGEALARQEIAKAHADLLAALGELRDEVKAERIALRVAEVAAKQSERKTSRASVAEVAEVAPPPAAVETSPGEQIPAPRPSTDAPEGDRVTLEISRPPPGCDAEDAAPEAEGLGDGDPTKVLSREATAAAMRGLAYNPTARGEPKPASESPASVTSRKAMRPPPSFIRPTRESPLNLELEDLLGRDSDEDDGDTLGPDDLTPANGALVPASSRLRNRSRGSRLTQ
jgi:hypothetical protein